nr:hypothetical protein [Verrucomicrobiota bacterium]
MNRKEAGTRPIFGRAGTALLIVAIALLCAVRNLPWHLDDKDQAKQAFVSHQMIGEGHWWFQHTPAGQIATKPPLAGWLSAGTYVLTGRQYWDLAWRLQGLLCAGLLLWLLWKAGDRLAGPGAGGFLAAVPFGLHHFTPRLATLVRTDMMLA